MKQARVAQQQLSDQSTRIRSLQNQVQGKEKGITSLKDEKAKLLKKVDEKTVHIQSLATSNKQKAEKLTTLQKQNNKLESEKKVLKTTVDKQVAQIRSLENANLKKEENIATVQTQNQKLEEEKKGFKGTVDKQSNQIRSLKTSDKQKAEQVAALQTQIEKLQEESQAKYEKLQESVNKALLDVDNYKKQLQDSQKQEDELSNKLRDKEIEVTTLTQKLLQLQPEPQPQPQPQPTTNILENELAAQPGTTEDEKLALREEKPSTESKLNQKTSRLLVRAYTRRTRKQKVDAMKQHPN